MGLVLLAAYAAVILLTAGKSMRGGGQCAFFVNNRSSSALGVGLSIIVSCVGASATIGVIGLAFHIGTPAFWWLGAGAVGLTALSLLLARKVRETGAYTMPQLVETFLGPAARPLISVLIVLAWMAILAAQFVAITRILQGLTGFSGLLCLAIGFALIVLHTLGGQAAIMRVDRIQALLMLLALLLLLGWLCLFGQAGMTGLSEPGVAAALGGSSEASGVGGLAWLSNLRFELVNDAFPPEKLVYFLFVVGGNYLVCPMLFGRLLSARNASSARLGGLIAVCGLVICSLLIVSIGLACTGLLPPDTPGDAVLGLALSSLVPSWLGLGVSLALVSVIVSSADSCLVTASTVLAHDLLRRDDTRTSRVCVVALGAAGLLLSLWGRDVLDYLLMAYDVYVCGVVAPVFIGLLASKAGGGGRTIQPRFACAAVVCGGVFGAASALSGENLFSYLGLITAAALTLAGLRRQAASEFNSLDSFNLKIR
jgi:SSS family solute:Na+ symporter